MAKIKAKITKEDLLLDLARRITANENGVRSYLQTAGISVDEGKGITLLDLKTLRELNEESFNNMIMFLYPEIFANSANGDGGEDDGEGGTSSNLTSEDKAGILNLFGNLVTTTGDTIKDIYGSATSRALLQYSQEQAARTRRMLILLGVFIAIILIVWMVVRMRRANWSVMINK